MDPAEVWEKLLASQLMKGFGLFELRFGGASGCLLVVAVGRG